MIHSYNCFNSQSGPKCRDVTEPAMKWNLHPHPLDADFMCKIRRMRICCVIKITSYYPIMATVIQLNYLKLSRCKST